MRGRPIDRTLAKVHVDENGCWIFHGAINDMGYGVVGVQGRNVRAHRITYETFVGLIPEGLDIDHLCRVRACCNPQHLEPVTRAENLLRGWAIRKGTHCAHGHERTEANTVVAPSEPSWPRCRICANERARGYRLRRKFTGDAPLREVAIGSAAVLAGAAAIVATHEPRTSA